MNMIPCKKLFGSFKKIDLSCKNVNDAESARLFCGFERVRFCEIAISSPGSLIANQEFLVIKTRNMFLMIIAPCGI